MKFDFKNEFINEVLITLGKKAYPKFGNIVILAGGAGSGKGFVTQNLLGIEGKILDVDALKVFAMKSPMLNDKVMKQMGVSLKDIDLKNPKNVSVVHKIVKDLGISDKKQRRLFDTIAASNPERKPNIIFDVTLDDIQKLIDIIMDTAELGYAKENIHIVWVVNDVKVALTQNQERSRVVPEDILIDTHEGAALTMKKIVNMGSKIKKYMDGAIVFAFNKKGQDSAIKASETGGFYVVDSAYVKVKEAGKKINLETLEGNIIDKIKKYTPTIDTWG